MISIEKLMNWEAVKTNVLIGIRPKSSDEKNVTMEFLDLEIYFYIPVFDNAIVKITYEMAERYNINQEDLLDVALENTSKKAKVRSMAEMMSEMMGIDVTMEDGMPDQIVITNEACLFGAGVIACEDILDSVCDKLRTEKICVLPSSIHEVIVINGDYMQYDDAKEMISSINSSTVDEKERLANHPYIYTKGYGFREVDNYECIMERP